jgi:hypothetical protein
MPGQERQPPPARVEPPTADGLGGPGAAGGPPDDRDGRAIDLATVASAPGTPSADFHGPLMDWPVYWWLSRRGVPFAYRDLAVEGRALAGPGVRGRGSFVVGGRAQGLIIEVAEAAWVPRAATEKQAGTARVAGLRAAGYRVVAVRTEQLQSELGDTMTAALAGIQRFAGLH